MILRTNLHLVALSIVVVLGIFAADMLLPGHLASGTLYIAVVPLLLLVTRPSFIMPAAVGCTLLSTVGFLASVAGPDVWHAAIDRVVPLLVIWISVGLVLQRRRGDYGRQQSWPGHDIRHVPAARLSGSGVSCRTPRPAIPGTGACAVYRR